MWLCDPLNDVLSSRAKVAALRVLFASPVPLTGREIARRAGVASGHASRILRDLDASGVVVSQDQRVARTYEVADELSPLLGALRTLFEAESRRHADFVSGLTQAVPDLVSVILYGSEARGDAMPGSDTDLLVVVGRRTGDLEDRLQELGSDLARQHMLALSWHTADLSDIREWETGGSDLWRNIRDEGITLTGLSPERLRRRCLRGKAG